MTISTLTNELPLLYKTPDMWADIPLKNIHALLSDHAYLERKAASNALELLNRWPEPAYPESWTVALSLVARDEGQHLHAVTRHLIKRGGRLQRLHRSQYAGDLRQLVRRGKGKLEILDRILISALIEARSCERFEILARVCPDAELAAFYGSLEASERGHHAVFLTLAAEIVSDQEWTTRWREMREAEARIIARQPVGPGLHSGVRP